MTDLLDAKYTFLNERLAKHYGIPGVYGSDFRRVELTPEFDMRRGLLGKASLETISSYPQRTTPTVRGKAMMKIFLGVSPPDPPPNVPTLKDQGAAVHGGARPTMRAADGNASQECALFDLPQDHGPDRVLDGEFRRGGHLADCGERQPRSMRPARWWMAPSWTA